MKCSSRCFSTTYCFVGMIAISLFGAGACASAQQAPATLAFEVATIKPAGPFDPKTMGWHPSPGRVSFTDLTLKRLIGQAYGLNDFQISGPGWIDSEHFDIVATYHVGASYDDTMKMLQTLLKERFGLAFHIEKREGQVYALVVGKHGSKLKPSPPDLPETDPDAPLKPGESYIGEGDKKIKVITNKDGSSTVNLHNRGTMTTKFDFESMTRHDERSKMTMEDLAAYLSPSIGSKVVDATGIKGNYQVVIDLPLGNRPAARVDASDGIPSDPQGALDLSLDALGLKLEKRKAPIDVYVVDHVEKTPTEN